MPLFDNDIPAEQDTESPRRGTMKSAIRACCAWALSERERIVMLQRLHGETFRAISLQLHITIDAAKRTEKRATRKIKAMIEAIMGVRL